MSLRRAACLLVGVAWASIPSSAQAMSFAWSPAIALNGGGARANVESVACPSARRCTAVTFTGQEATFDPTVATGPTPVTIDGTTRLNRVYCPSTAECVAIDATGKELTFDPSAPEAPAAVSIGVAAGLTCTSATQCVAVGSSQEVTFDPTAPGAPTPVTIASGFSVIAVACPTPSQCTAVGPNYALTFNPTSPGTPTPLSIDVGSRVAGVACPATTQCTAVDGAGQEITFDPTSAASPTPVSINAGISLNAVACPATTQCVAVDGAGRALVGDPTSSAPWAIERIAGANDILGIACPATGQCVVVDTVDNAFLGVAGPVSTSPPSIAGAPVQGQSLTEVHGAWSPTPIAYSYQWERCSASGDACTAMVSATTQTYTLTTADVGATIRVQETTTDADGPSLPATSAPTAVVTAPSSGGGGGSPPPSPPPPGTILTVSGYRLTNNPFVVTASRTPLTATAAATKHRKGTTFKYTLSEAATVKIAFSQRLLGRRRGRACVAPSAKLRHARRCTRTFARGALIRASHQGANSVRFSGRIGATPLKPGQYEATLTATAANNHSSRSQTRTFRVVLR